MASTQADDNLMAENGKQHKTSKSPVEKMRIRLAAEGYDKKYMPMDESDDEPSDESKKLGNCCGSQSTSPCIVLIAVGLIVIAGFTVLAILLKIRLDQANKVCSTPDCVITSGITLSKMNVSVDPCHDFYEYSCAAFTSNVNIPPDKAYYTTLGGDMESRKKPGLRRLLEAEGAEYKGKNSTAVAKARQFYAACMNTTSTESQGSTPLLKLIKSLGSWTVTSGAASGSWIKSSWAIESSLAAVNLYGLYPFFSTVVVADDRNSSVNILSMDQDGLSLFDYKSYISNSSEKFRRAYIDFFVAIAGLLGGGNNAQTLADNVWQLEKAIAEIYVPPENREDVRNLYNLLSIDDIQKYFGKVLDVSQLLRNVYGSRFDRSKPIVVRVPGYFRKLGKVLSAAEPETVANYIVWQAVCAMVPFMPNSYRLAALQLRTAIYGITADSQRWEFCTKQAETALGFATGALYVDRYFSQSDRNKVEGVLNRVWAEFKYRLARNAWMDESTRKTAVEKAETLLYKIGYPEFVTSVTALDSHYSQLEATDSSFQNELNAAAFSVQKNIAKLGVPTDKTEWSMTPDQINAYYDPAVNQIVIPAGILQQPLYDAAFPESLIFGSIGFILGHEITHGFDNTGRQYDKFGNMVDWWGNSSARQFETLAQCFVDEYSSFEVYGQKLNGISTKDENIADNGGIRMSYLAYRKWLTNEEYQDKLLPGLNMTHEQQFFLGFAQTWCAYYRPQFAIQLLVTDVHSNAKYRVNGVVRNMPEFAEAFGCPNGSPMNPTQKCTLW